MPQIKNVVLFVLGSAGELSARIEYDLEISATELRLNISLWEVAAVIGQKVDLDEWLPKAPYLRRIPPKRDQLDALVTYAHQGTLTPDGQSLVHRAWTVSLMGPWEEGRPGPGDERLRPLVYVTPLEVDTDLVIGAGVDVDVGE